MWCFALEVLFTRLSFVAEYIPIPSEQGAHTSHGFGQFLQKCDKFLQGDLLKEVWDTSSPAVRDWESTKRFLLHDHTANNLFWVVPFSLVCSLWLWECVLMEKM